jgi:hypothetical protein
MSISPISTSAPVNYQYVPPVNAASAASPVGASNDPGLAQQASTLSATAGIIATLGTAAATDSQTYDAAGLYNSIAQAGTSATIAAPVTVPAEGGNTQVAAQQSLNSSILSTLPNSSVTSGFYNGSGVLQSTASSGANLTANWASALQTNPNLSHVVAADSYAQGIIGTLSVTA